MNKRISLLISFFCLAVNAQQNGTDESFEKSLERSITSQHAKNIKVNKIIACELYISYTMYFFDAVKEYRTSIPLKGLQILEDGTFYNKKGILVERFGKYYYKKTITVLADVSLEVNLVERKNLIREIENLSTKCD